MTKPVAFIFAHPDDESFLCAALIRKLADEANKPVLLQATNGEAGKKNGAYSHATDEELAAIREKEMRTAAEILGLSAVQFLGYPDGKLNTAEEQTFVQRVADFIQVHESQVVVTFPEDGGNYHPDHMAISRIVTKAVLEGRCPSVKKLYYVLSNPLLEQGRRASLTVDSKPYWPVKAKALQAHQSQKLAIGRYFGPLDACPEQRRYESFVLAWEDGVHWPSTEEAWIW